ncbi:membrane protein [Streptomyces sp. NRRL WC-3549]|uniref:membrane protein n=1 Tax=Streptomyces sp. NRRL WC-3549 TaxID=1463925 RepID=UPI00056145C7|nr:membrane protein [Streptomyces sp. NRRL WC-3549]
MPPPKPGVIPLAPLRLGDLLGGAFATMGRYAKQLFGLAAALYGGGALVMGFAVLVVYGAVGDSLERVAELGYDQEPATGDISALLISGGVLVLLGIAVMLVVSGLMYAVVPAVVQEAVLGRPAGFVAVWRRAWASLVPVMGTLFLTALVTVVPAVLLLVGLIGVTAASFSTASGSGGAVVLTVAILGVLATGPLAIWVWVKFSLAPAVVVFERTGPVTALRRSSRLVRGDWWRLFGILLLVYLMAGVAGYFIQLPFMFLGMFPTMIGSTALGGEPSFTAFLAVMGGYFVALLLGQMVSQIVSTTFPQLVVSLLYVDRRIRTEDLGPALAEAAGVPPQQGPYPPPYPPPYGGAQW